MDGGPQGQERVTHPQLGAASQGGVKELKWARQRAGLQGQSRVTEAQAQAPEAEQRQERSNRRMGMEPGAEQGGGTVTRRGSCRFCSQTSAASPLRSAVPEKAPPAGSFSLHFLI